MTTEYTLRNKLLTNRSIRNNTYEDELAELMGKNLSMNDRGVVVPISTEQIIERKIKDFCFLSIQVKFDVIISAFFI